MWWLVPFAVLLASAAGTRLAIAYAERRQLLDLPGQRRSHTRPTPRGGGLGPVLAMLAGLGAAAGAGWRPPFPGLPALLAALLLVAGVGWRDDHGGLAARWRMLAHLAAALLLALPAAGAIASLHAWLPAGAWLVLLPLAVSWSINLHNFMDGIDALLGMQVLFVTLVLGCAFRQAGATGEALATVSVAAAAAGFLFYNRPPARIFMGDVGSGTFGLAIGLLALWQAATPGSHPALALAAGSAFIIDATATLCWRVARGRRWYSAHREHLYQWLVRAGWTHGRAVSAYLAWNVLIVLPFVSWLAHAGPAAGWLLLAVLYAVSLLAWWAARRACLRHIRRRHVPA